MEQALWIVIAVLIILLWGAMAEINHLKRKYEDDTHSKWRKNRRR